MYKVKYIYIYISTYRGRYIENRSKQVVYDVPVQRTSESALVEYQITGIVMKTRSRMK